MHGAHRAAARAKTKLTELRDIRSGLRRDMQAVGMPTSEDTLCLEMRPAVVKQLKYKMRRIMLHGPPGVLEFTTELRDPVLGIVGWAISDSSLPLLLYNVSTANDVVPFQCDYALPVAGVAFAGGRATMQFVIPDSNAGEFNIEQLIAHTATAAASFTAASHVQLAYHLLQHHDVSLHIGVQGEEAPVGTTADLVCTTTSGAINSSVRVVHHDNTAGVISVACGKVHFAALAAKIQADNESVATQLLLNIRGSQLSCSSYMVPRLRTASIVEDGLYQQLHLEAGVGGGTLTAAVISCVCDGAFIMQQRTPVGVGTLLHTAGGRIAGVVRGVFAVEGLLLVAPYYLGGVTNTVMAMYTASGEQVVATNSATAVFEVVCEGALAGHFRAGLTVSMGGTNHETIIATAGAGATCRCYLQGAPPLQYFTPPFTLDEMASSKNTSAQLPPQVAYTGTALSHSNRVCYSCMASCEAHMHIGIGSYDAPAFCLALRELVTTAAAIMDPSQVSSPQCGVSISADTSIVLSLAPASSGNMMVACGYLPSRHDDTCKMLGVVRPLVVAAGGSEKHTEVYITPPSAVEVHITSTPPVEQVASPAALTLLHESGNLAIRSSSSDVMWDAAMRNAGSTFHKICTKQLTVAVTGASKTDALSSGMVCAPQQRVVILLDIMFMEYTN